MPFDCSRFRDQCRAECCGPAVVPGETWYKYKHLVRVALKYETVDHRGYVHVCGKDGACPFLHRRDRTCMIYPKDGEPDERAEVCRIYGVREDVDALLACPYQDGTGRKRKRHERKELKQAMNERQERIIKSLRRANGR